MAANYQNDDIYSLRRDYLGDEECEDCLPSPTIKKKKSPDFELSVEDTLEKVGSIQRLDGYTPNKKRTNSSLFYQKISNISSGANGKVWKVRDSITSGELAYKEPLNSSNSIFKFKSQDKNEIDIMSRSVHPNIISFVGITVDYNNRNLLVGTAMELSGFTLNKMLNSGPIDVLTRKKWSNQIISAIECLHRYNYVHCDLKSNNILIMKNGDAKLADFGLTRHENDFSWKINNYFKCGIIAYRPPEFIRSIEDFKGGYSRVAGFAKPLLDRYKSKHSKGVTWNSLVSGELFSLGMVLLDIYANKELLSNFDLEIIIKFILKVSLYSTEERRDYIRDFMRNKGEHEPEWAMVISKLTRGNPQTRLIPFNQIIIPDFERHEKGEIVLGKPRNYKIDDMVLYNSVVRGMVGCVIAFRYNIWQLASALALFRYVIPRYISHKNLWHHVGLCCLYMSLGLPVEITLKNMEELLNKYKSITKLVIEDEIVTRVYVDIYVYMNGIIRVMSTADVAENGLVLAHSLSYYQMDIQPDIVEYVAEIHQKVMKSPLIIYKKTSIISSERELIELVIDVLDVH
jgi:serine/threonine protein kinase